MALSCTNVPPPSHLRSFESMYKPIQLQNLCRDQIAGSMPHAGEKPKGVSVRRVWTIQFVVIIDQMLERRSHASYRVESEKGPKNANNCNLELYNARIMQDQPAEKCRKVVYINLSRVIMRNRWKSAPIRRWSTL